MTGINKAIILGNMGQDPETHTASASGAAITVISVATSEKWKDKQTGQDQERTEWHRIKFFGRLAEVVAQYTRKGSKVYVEGKFNTDPYEKNGEKRYSTCIIGQKIEFLDSRQSDSGGYQNQHSQAQQQQAQQAPIDDFNDDIPF
jgi:single-strand DNA-binding protein